MVKNKYVLSVIIALVLITAASFGGYTYIQGFVYHEYNTRNYQVETSINGDKTTLVFTLDKNEAYSDTNYTKKTVLPDDFGKNLYGDITIRPEPTMNDDGTPALDENGNLQYADWSILGSDSESNTDISFSDAMKLAREGKTAGNIETNYTYTCDGDKIILTVVIDGYEFKNGDNIHIEVSNDEIVAGGIHINNNSLALTNIEFQNGKFSEVENMFVNTSIEG